MQTLSDLHDFFQAFIEQSTGVSQVILADQGRDPPEGLYATYNPIPVRTVAHPRRSESDAPAQDPVNLQDWTDLNRVLHSQLELILSTNFMNDGARDAAWRLHDANFRGGIQTLLFNNNVAMRYTSEVRRLTDIIQAGLQPRYQVDVFFYVEADNSEVVLRAADFSVNIEDKAGNQL